MGGEGCKKKGRESVEEKRREERKGVMEIG